MATSIWNLRRRGSALLTLLALLAAAALVHPQVAHVTPQAPQGVTAFASDGQASVAWQSAGASSYDVLRGTSPTSVGTVVATGVSGTSYTDTGLTNGLAYYYAVRASGGANPVSSVAGATPQARSCSTGNATVVENCFPGTTAWKTTNAGPAPAGIEGFATTTSITAGQSLDLKVNTASGATYRVEIYRTGWYGGTQGRLISTLEGLTGIQQDPCVKDPDSGIVDCGNWSTSATITTTAAWPSGVYLARLVRDDGQGDNHVLFVVRHDGDHADVDFQVPTNTYEAYNNYGGRSLYTYNSSGNPTVSGTARAVQVSYNRPFVQSNIGDRNWYTSSDLQTVSWLERQGYAVDYDTSVDLSNGTATLANHHVAISGSHDEYWTSGMRDAAQSARDAGTSLIFLGGNAVYWRVRLATSPVTGASDRTVICYKTIESGGPDPVSPTSTWRDPAGPNSPENPLVGQWYIGDNDNVFFPLVVSAAQGQDRFWRHTSLASLAAGTTARVGTNLVGWEWDAPAQNGLDPAGLRTLASSPVNGDLLTDAGHSRTSGPATVTSTEYRAASGALVWATGTNQWARGLGLNMAGVGEPNVIIQQATANMLGDMGVRPATPQSNLVIDTPGAWSLTGQVPSPAATAVSVSNPVKATLDRSIDPSTLTTSTFLLRGPDGQPVPASVSWDESTLTATLQPNAQLDALSSYTATLTTGVKTWTGDAPTSDSAWSFTTGLGQPPSVTSKSPAASATGVSTGTKVTATFDRTVLASSVTSQTFTLTVGGQPVAASVSYDATTRTATLTPSSRLSGATQYQATLTTGIKATDNTPMTSNVSWTFTTNPSLSVTGRFPAVLASGLSTATDVRATFSRSIDASTLTAQSFTLTASDGTAIPATVSYDDTSKTADLIPSQPLALMTTYTATVTTGVVALDGEPLGSAVSWTFSTATTPPPSPNAATLQPAAGSTGAPLGGAVIATFNMALDPATVTPQTVLVRDASSTALSGRVTYDATAQTVTFQPTAQLVPGATYTATLTTGIRSTTGAPLAANVVWSFTAADCPCNLMPSSMLPATTGVPVRDGRSGAGPWSYELGTKITVDQAMKLTALRFYKDAAETGTHVGTVWSSTGTQLARVTFAKETASGWQRQVLATPLALSANTTYVVSVGFNAYFDDTQYGLQTALDSGPLHSIADGNDGVFGASAGTFPTQSYHSSNYFVDAVVRTPTSSAPTPHVASTVPLDTATGVAVNTAVRAQFDIPLDDTTVTGTSFSLTPTAGGSAVPATVTYDAVTQTARLTPSQDLAYSTSYTARLTTAITSDEGAPLANDYTWRFSTAAAPQPAVTSTSPSSGAVDQGSATTPQATFSVALNPSTITASTFTLANGQGAAVAATVSYDATTKTATLTPTARLSAGTYTARVDGSVASTQGTTLGSAKTWTFTVASCPCSLWPSSATPVTAANSTRDGRPLPGPWSYEVGTKIQVSSGTDVTAIRFYKSPGETGTHVGTLWTSTGQKITQVTFAGETASGWQQQALVTPVTLSPGSVYVVSVGANTYFPSTTSGLATARVSGPVSSVADGANGVYGGAAGVLPTSSYKSTAYFVDVVAR